MRFYGQFNPPVDQFLYERYFRTYQYPGFFIECGAADGESESSCKFFEESLNWSGLNIEPNPYLFDLLTKNRPQTKNLNLALSNKTGTASFKNAIHPRLGRNFGNGSLHHTEAHLEELRSQNCEFEEFSVKTTTFESVIEEHKVREIDLMVLDVEGHELQVLDGMVRAQCLPRVLCVEHGQLGLEGIRRPLQDMGYTYDTQSFVNSVWLLTGFRK